MERHKVDEQAAFDTLTKISQNRNIKLRDLAHTINTTGKIPPVEPNGVRGHRIGTPE